MLMRVFAIFLFFLFIFTFYKAYSQNARDSSLTRKLMRGYEKLPPPGALTTVEIGIYINYFFAISEQSMDYRMSFYLRQNWSDPRLRFNASRNSNKTRLKLEDSQIKDVWVPDVFFRNEKGAGYHFVTQPNRLCYIQSNGYMWYVSKITATFSCPMKLQNYPMDVQYCPLQLESFGYTTDTISFKWIDPKEKAVEFDKTGQEQPESVVNPDVLLEDCSYNDTSGFSDKRIPCLQVNFIVTRPMGYFFIQFYIPSVLLVILSWVSFWISVDAVVARVNIGLMSVLNLVTQSTGSRNQLPKVSYVKAIDVWMTACLVFAFASLIEFAIVNVWSRIEENVKQQAAAAATAAQQQQQQQPQQSQYPMQHSQQHSQHSQHPQQQQRFQLRPQHASHGRSDRSVQQIYVCRTDRHEIIPMVPLDEAPQFASRGQRRQSWSRKRLRDWTSSFSREQPRAQKLDKLSRRLFPLTFLIFNIIYWTAYNI